MLCLEEKDAHERMLHRGRLDRQMIRSLERPLDFVKVPFVSPKHISDRILHKELRPAKQIANISLRLF